METFHPIDQKWIRVIAVHPTDPMGSLSNNKSDGSRDLYLYECAKDDSKSTIYTSGVGADAEAGRFRAVLLNRSKLKVVKELREGEVFEMEVVTDRVKEKRKVRFTHKKGIY